MMHCLPLGIDNMSALPPSDYCPFPHIIISEILLAALAMGNEKWHGGNKKCMIDCGLCLKRLSYWWLCYTSNIQGIESPSSKNVVDGIDVKNLPNPKMEQDGLNWQLRWELKVLFFNALGRDCWDGPCPSVILVGRAGLLAGLFIAGWAGLEFSHNTQAWLHVKICKYTHTNLH